MGTERGGMRIPYKRVSGSSPISRGEGRDWVYSSKHGDELVR